MSYCRWSSDDFACDVYVYADVRGGWTTHVAGRKRVPVEPMPPPVAETLERDEWAEAWLARYKRVREILDASPLVPIGLPHDDEDFNDPTPGACVERLEHLRTLGYQVPQYAIDALREEAAEG